MLIWAHPIAQGSFKHLAILQPQPPKYWDGRHEPPHPAKQHFVSIAFTSHLFHNVCHLAPWETAENITVNNIGKVLVFCSQQKEVSASLAVPAYLGVNTVHKWLLNSKEIHAVTPLEVKAEICLHTPPLPRSELLSSATLDGPILDKETPLSP